MALTMLDKQPETALTSAWTPELVAEFEREKSNPNPCVGNALVSESESRAVSGAFRRDAGAEALDAYRKADGNAALAEEARKALAAEHSPEPVGDVAFLRAIRGLRSEAAKTPSPSRPKSPASATSAGWLLLWAMAAAAIAGLLAFAAGRSRPATT